jgi:ABC-type nickel/cobalt efflux system permease component RcnA
MSVAMFKGHPRTIPACCFSVFSFVFFVSLWLFFFPATANSHPVPQKAHDRTIVIHLTEDRAIVNYRLEVNEFTVVYDDLPAFGDQIDLTKLTKPADFYNAFLSCYAPILAGNLLARVDDQPLTFACQKKSYTLRDEDGKALGHLRCDFQFEAPIRLTGRKQHQFKFREVNYEFEEGKIRLSVDGQGPLEFVSKNEPDKALQERPFSELRPGDDYKLRSASATFAVSATKPRPEATPQLKPGQDTNPELAAASGGPDTSSPESAEVNSLLDLLLDANRGIWVLLSLAAFFGAAHALTPGHGKTLVAAYLVGEQGTVWHALVLGLITTLTHTGAVIALAGALLVVNPERMPNLELFGGMLVAGMGLWILFRRLGGQADHLHMGGHGHHHGHAHDHSHHHGAPNHYHDEHGYVHPLPASATLGGWRGLVLLGISGGIVPCTDAIVLLLFAVSAHRLWLALPLLLAFSAGLAGVLIGIGVVVVQFKGWVSPRSGRARWFQALPLVSAVLVTIMGLWLCFKSLHSQAPTPSSPAVVRSQF